MLLAGVSAVAAQPASAAHDPATSSSPRAASSAHTRSTHFLLNHLTVHAAHYGGYERSKFQLWTSHPDGCNTRYQVLIRDAKRKPHVGSGCYLTHGKWISPYDGTVSTNPTKVQIDHVVPLAVAWGSGAFKWNAATRKRFANDLGTHYDLLAVSAHSNESKGDDGPDQWLPPRKAFDCRYMADYTAVLWRWHLTIDEPEKAFLHSHLATCGWPHVTEPKRPAIHDTHSGTGHEKHHACTKTSSGSCIRAGEFCPVADYGKVGYDGAGKKLVCTGSKTHPHWEAN